MCFNQDSRSASTNTTQNIKKDLVIGNGAQGYAADNGSTIKVTNNMSDAGAIKGAFDFAAIASGNSAKMADSIAGKSFLFADNTMSKAFDFAAKSQGDVFGLVASTNALAGQNYDRLLSTTSNALTGILDGISSTQNFIAGTQAQAQGAMDNNTKKTIIVAGFVALAVVIYAVAKK